MFKEYKTMEEVPDTSYIKVDRYSEKKMYINKDRIRNEGLKIKKPKYSRAKEKFRG